MEILTTQNVHFFMRKFHRSESQLLQLLQTEIYHSSFGFLQAGAAPLPCNHPRDKYLYELVVYTGTRNNAGIFMVFYLFCPNRNYLLAQFIMK